MVSIGDDVQLAKNFIVQKKATHSVAPVQFLMMSAVLVSSVIINVGVRVKLGINFIARPKEIHIANKNNKR